MSEPTASQQQSTEQPRAPIGYFVPFGHMENSDHVDLVSVINLLWANVRFIALFVFLAVLFAGVYAFTTPKQFKADTLIAPNDSNSASGTGGLASLAGALGGLASLTGVNLGTGGDKDVSIATLQSRALIENLIRDENLLPVLFADKWDENQKAWLDPEHAPTLLDGFNVFQKKVLKVTEDKKTLLVTVEVEWTSPQLAAHWANELVRRTNLELQQKALRDSDHHVEYLQGQLQQTSLVDMRQSIYALLENELKNAMVAKGNDQYAFKVIDPAVVPEKKVWPKRALILVASFLGGLFVSSMGVLAYNSLYKKTI